MLKYPSQSQGKTIKGLRHHWIERLKMNAGGNYWDLNDTFQEA